MSPFAFTDSYNAVCEDFLTVSVREKGLCCRHRLHFYLLCARVMYNVKYVFTVQFRRNCQKFFSKMSSGVFSTKFVDLQWVFLWLCCKKMQFDY